MAANIRSVIKLVTFASVTREKESANTRIMAVTSSVACSGVRVVAFTLAKSGGAIPCAAIP